MFLGIKSNYTGLEWVNNARNFIFGSIVPLKRPHLCFVFPAGTSMMWKRVKRYLDALFRSVARTLMSTAGRCQPRALPAFTTSSSPVCFWLRGWKWSKGQWCFHGNNLSRHMCVCMSFRCDVHSLMWRLTHTNTNTHMHILQPCWHVPKDVNSVILLSL